METEKRFKDLKEEILERAKMASACREQYGRAYRSETLAELMQVVKDNFHWACDNKVVTPLLVEIYREEFAGNDIFLNVDVESGFLLCDNASVEACGNASVEAYGNASVEAYGNASVVAYDNASVAAYGNASVGAYGNASVRAYDNASVRAYDNASVAAYDNASVEACGNASVGACGNASVEAYGNASVEACGNASVEACGNASVRASGNASVEACGNAYISSYHKIKCELHDNAIHRVESEDTIYYASDKLKFVKV